jgi:hypothetical protein
MPTPLCIRPATVGDRFCVRKAIVELQEFERSLHTSRLPGEQIADAYLAWMEGQASAQGAMLVAEIDGHFVGFVAGWIEKDDAIAETRTPIGLPIWGHCTIYPESSGKSKAVSFQGHRRISIPAAVGTL